MEHKLHEIWKEKEGSKNIWKLQAPRGILTFDTKKEAIAFRNIVKYVWG